MISLVKNPLTFTVSVDYKTSESGKTYLKNMQKFILNKKMNYFYE